MLLAAVDTFGACESWHWKLELGRAAVLRQVLGTLLAGAQPIESQEPKLQVQSTLSGQELVGLELGWEEGRATRTHRVFETGAASEVFAAGQSQLAY